MKLRANIYDFLAHGCQWSSIFAPSFILFFFNFANLYCRPSAQYSHEEDTFTKLLISLVLASRPDKIKGKKLKTNSSVFLSSSIQIPISGSAFSVDPK